MSEKRQQISLLSIAVVDDEEDTIFTIKHLLKNKVRVIQGFSHPDEFLQSTEEFDVIFLDMNYHIRNTNGEEGLFWLKKIQKEKPDISITMMTNHSSLNLAVQSIHEGAGDFINKPIIKDKLLLSLERLLKLKKRNKVEKKGSEHIIIGSSPEIKEIYSMIEKIAKTDVNVLILGENGTGKQKVAQQIHEFSSRAEKEFVHIDIGSINQNLFESELFGHVKGAFTDAKTDKQGVFEVSKEGTLFIDEIANVPLHLQTKLLKAIQEQKVSRVGSAVEITVKPRLVFATNSDLKNAVEEGSFREDLLYRINTVEIHIPPLRERKIDIPDYANHFLSVYNKKHNSEVNSITKEAMDILKEYSWPGNIRELEHAIERAIILSDGLELERKDFEFLKLYKKPPIAKHVQQDLASNEKECIEKALLECKNNISRTATVLGISRYALYRKLKKFEIEH